MLKSILNTRLKLLLAAGTLGAIVLAAGGAVAVYFMFQDTGNGGMAAGETCSETETATAKVAPAIGGDLAAFRLTSEPDLMTDLVFKVDETEETGIGGFAGKAVLLNLWATWCAPCRAEMPSLDRLQAELGGDEFEVVAVNIDTGDPERARAFLEEIEVSNLAFYADSSTRIFSDLKRRGLALGLPVTLLIDPSGCLVGSVQGPAEWDSNDAKGLITALLNPEAPHAAAGAEGDAH